MPEMMSGSAYRSDVMSAAAAAAVVGCHNSYCRAAMVCLKEENASLRDQVAGIALQMAKLKVNCVADCSVLFMSYDHCP